MRDSTQLKPPAKPAPFSRDPRQWRDKLFAYFGFGVPLAVVAAIVMLLPALAAPPPSGLRVAQIKSDTGEPAPAAQKSAIAEQQLEIALRHQARLENSGVRVWGVERLVTSYAEATRKLVDGDAHSRDGIKVFGSRNMMCFSPTIPMSTSKVSLK